MEQPLKSEKFLRKRKFFLVIPVILVPILLLFTWALGRGKPAEKESLDRKGLNMNLPGAYVKRDQMLDKMSYYDQAKSDSDKYKALTKSDPYFKSKSDTSAGSLSNLLHGERTNTIDGNQASPPKTSGYGRSYSTEPNERKVYEKLAS